MANPEHLDILKQGVEVWNRLREEHPSRRPNLSDADLKWQELNDINLSEVELSGVKLNGATLRRANLDKAALIGAELTGADLHNASLVEAYLVAAKLLRTNLTEADLHGVILGETILSETDLTAARGLDSCRHLTASFIDYWTLARSGTLPLAFLRGCGLPDALIDYLPSLLNEPIQLYSVFISYSHRDEAFAKRLYDALQGKGVRCWYAPEDMKGGKKIHEQIDAAIRVYDKLLLVLSDHSMNSKWVKTELADARRREVTENKRLLFPIRLVDYETIRNWTYFDADTGKDSAREIREYFIRDFSNWKDHDSFETAFERLLRDLKADDTQPTT